MKYKHIRLHQWGITRA